MSYFYFDHALGTTHFNFLIIRNTNYYGEDVEKDLLDNHEDGICLSELTFRKIDMESAQEIIIRINITIIIITIKTFITT